MWAVAALGLAVALAPLYVSLCQSLARVSARGGHRLIGVQRGNAELERLRAALPVDRRFPIPELPSGRGTVTVSPGPVPELRRVDLQITWDERGVTARAAWTTLVSGAE